jgi:hypothetical protein
VLLARLPSGRVLAGAAASWPLLAGSRLPVSAALTRLRPGLAGCVLLPLPGNSRVPLSLARCGTLPARPVLARALLAWIVLAWIVLAWMLLAWMVLARALLARTVGARTVGACAVRACAVLARGGLPRRGLAVRIPARPAAPG